MGMLDLDELLAPDTTWRDELARAAQTESDRGKVEAIVSTLVKVFEESPELVKDDDLAAVIRAAGEAGWTIGRLMKLMRARGR